MIKLVPIDAVRASEYNPGATTKSALPSQSCPSVLGFLLPIYADESGEI